MGTRLRALRLAQGAPQVVGDLADKMLAEAQARRAAEAPSGAGNPPSPAPDGSSLALRMLREKAGPDYMPPKNSAVGRSMYGDGPIDSPELRRIIALPKRTPGAPDLTSALRHTARCYGGCVLCAPRPKNPCFEGCPLCEVGEAHLWPLQSEALYWAQIANGLLGAIGVGGGKTLVTLLLPTYMPSARAVLLVPPQLRDQLKKMTKLYRRHWRVPEIAFGAGPEFDGLRVFGYSEISVMSGAHALIDADPDLVICDEAHYLRHRSAVRTSRFINLFRSRPGRRLVALSGSMTTKSIKDYGHLMELALRKSSALPRPWPELDDWSRVIDANVDEERRMPPGALVLLGADKPCAPTVEAVRAAYRERLLATPGVVSSAANALPMTLTLRAVRPKISPEVRAAIAKLENTWTRPDGEEIESPLAMAKVLREMCFGFYYVWDWPNGEPDLEWMTARALWHKEQRDYLKTHNKLGMDSPGYLAAAAASGRWQAKHWPRWSVIADRYGPDGPPVKTIWLDRDFAPRLVRAWMSDGPGIIWYEHTAIGIEIARVFQLEQFDGGTDKQLLAATPETTPHPVCSIRAHGTGKELQAWSRAIVLGAVANGTAYEQLLGRLHRDGQQADEVEYVIPLHHESLEAALDNAMAHAQYKEETFEGRQKLLYANIIR